MENKRGSTGQEVFAAAAQALLQPAHVRGTETPLSARRASLGDNASQLKTANGWHRDPCQEATGLSIGQSAGPFSARQKTHGFQAPGSRRGSFSARGEARSTGAKWGNIMMRGSARDCRDHVARGRETQEQQDLRAVCEQIGQKAAQKFRTVREALRFVDADRDGSVSKSEMQYFFRAYDVSDSKYADMLFDRLDPHGLGEIPYDAFLEFIGPFIRGEPSWLGDNSEESTREPTPEDVAVPKQPWTKHVATARQKGASKVLPGKNGAAGSQENWGLDEWMMFIGMKSSERFHHIMDLVRLVDRDYNGWISKGELRYFFSVFGLTPKVSDQCFGWLLKPGATEVEYYDFMKACAPHCDLPGVGAVLQKGEALSSPAAAPKRERLNNKLPGPQASSEEQAQAAIQRRDLKEVRSMMQDMGRKLQLKFRHVRDAFRTLDLDKDGHISPDELRAFVRGFGWPDESADRLFTLLDETGCGELEYHHFMSLFESVAMPAGRLAARTRPEVCEDRQLNKHVTNIARIIAENLATKHRRVGDAFRMLDLNNDGHVSIEELRVFFKHINMPLESADTLFQYLDQDGSGEVQFNEFMSLIGPIIQPGTTDSERSAEELRNAQRPVMWRLT